MQVGTKQAFGDWLYAHKKLTVSKYSKLDTATKLAIQQEYRGKGKP